MENHKKKRGRSNFSTPAIIAAFYLSLQFVVEFPVALLLYMIQLTNDIVMSRLIVLIISQVIEIGIFIFIIIPFLKIKDVEFSSISYSNFFTFLTIFCLFWALLIPITLSFSVISNILGIEVDFFRNVLPLSRDPSGGLFSIIIWLLAGILGVAIFLEYLYRRTLIPLLEKRGMSPLSAVLVSSCAFALANIPFDLGFQITYLRESNLLNIYLTRYDLVNSLFYSLNIFITPFLLGIACGIVYILTRNIFFSILTHCLGILPYYLLELFKDNLIFLSLLGLLIVMMNITGIFVAIYTLYSFLTTLSQPNWMTILKKKSLVDINRGLVGFFSTFAGIILYMVILIGLLAEHAPIPVTLLFNIVFLGLCFRNIRKDALRRQSYSDHYELKESGDVS